MPARKGRLDEELRIILLEINDSLYLKEGYAFNSMNFKKNTLEEYHKVFANNF